MFENLNLSKDELEKRIEERDGLAGNVRSYKMVSVKLDEAWHFRQEGSGPNFQGGWLTLCTCRHEIRAEKAPEEWEDGWWFAGFTSSTLLCDRPWLFYLAKVKAAYESQAELWRALPGPVRQAKCSRYNRLGDVYQPNRESESTCPWDSDYYHPAIMGHSHRPPEYPDAWRWDIEFFHGAFQRRAPQILAEPTLTFLWQEPMLYLTRHPRNRTWWGIETLLTTLRTVGS